MAVDSRRKSRGSPEGDAGGVYRFGVVPDQLLGLSLAGGVRALRQDWCSARRLLYDSDFAYAVGGYGAGAGDHNSKERPEEPVSAASEDRQVDVSDLALCKRDGCCRVFDAVSVWRSHRLKRVPQVRIESTVGVFLSICVPQAHRDRLGPDLWHRL